MKRAIRACLAAFAAVLILAAGVRPAAARERDEQRDDRRHAPRVVIKMHRVDVPRPKPIQDAKHIINDNRRIAFPTHDERGVAIVKEQARMPPEHHGVILGNEILVKTILGLAGIETQRQHYYWHTDNGVKYAHYVDHGGVHWYGFYHGTTFYWSRYYANRWWWHDEHQGRWVYWADGYWWWQAPNGEPYVYVDNNYYPYEKGGVVTVRNPELVAPPTSIPAGNQGTTTMSPDRTRSIQVSGPRSEAFLYDNSSGTPAFLKYIGPEVASVKFSGGAGRPLEILANYKDGNFALFDASGNTIEAPATQSDVPAGAASGPTPSAPPPDGDQIPGDAPAPPGNAPAPPSDTPAPPGQ
jgi:hypothetical protein